MNTGIRTATTQTDAEELALAILGVRTRPLVLISSNPTSNPRNNPTSNPRNNPASHPTSRPRVNPTATPATGPLEIDASGVVKQVGDVADVWTIVTGDATFALSKLLPPRTEVYRGAGRSYPVGFGHDPRPDRSPLRFPGKKALSNLVDDVLAQANLAGLFNRATTRSIEAAGTVIGFIAAGSRALVEVGGRADVAIWHELTFPDVPLEWVLTRGQAVRGALDLDSRRLSIHPTPHSARSLAQVFPHLSITNALVRDVSGDHATLLLHPEVAICLSTRDVSPNPLDTMDLLLTEGDVVSVRVVHLQDEQLHLRLTDIDDDEPVLPSVSLLDGGGPWLEPGRVLVDHRAQLFDAEEHAEPQGLVAPLPPETSVANRELDRQPAPDEQPALDRQPAPDEQRALSEISQPVTRPMPGPGARRIDDSLTEAAVETPATASVEPPVTAPIATAPASGALHGALLELQQARARIRSLEDQLIDAGADDSQLRKLHEIVRGSDAQRREARLELGEALHEIDRIKAELSRAKRALLDARNQKPLRPAEASRDERIARWSSPDLWLRHEIYLSWVDRIAPSERADWPLVDYRLGEKFTPSLEALDDGQLIKALRTVIEVVTGRGRTNGAHRIHPLRTGDGGDDPAVVRRDGARCFRASIEDGTPAARRLHYWMLPDGSVELSRVVTHDVMEP